MALQKLPAVAGIENFDWAGHEDSRAALFSGGPTGDFRKETWNAIVDTLALALAQAGFSFDPAACRITQSYGPLTAEAFNRVVAAMTLPAPLRWAWENREDFPGYVGRRAFEKGEAVYAAYLWELVRRLNLLLDILKNQAPFGELSGGENIRVPASVRVRSRKVAPAAAETMARSLAFTRLLARRILLLTGEAVSGTAHGGSVKVPRAAPVEGRGRAWSCHRGLVRTPAGRSIKARGGSNSQSCATAWVAAAAPVSGGGGGMSQNWCRLAIGWLAPVRLEGLWIRQSRQAVQENDGLEVD